MPTPAITLPIWEPDVANSIVIPTKIRTRLMTLKFKARLPDRSWPAWSPSLAVPVASSEFLTDPSAVLKARVQLIIGALLFSTGGVAIKAATLTGWQVSCFRSLLGGLVILALIPRARQGWTWRSLVVAVPFAATFTCFTLSNKLTTAANAMFLQETAPFYVLLLGPLLLGERIVRRDLAFMAALVAGLVLILGFDGEPLDTAPNPRLGNLLGACTGIAWALTLTGLRWLASRPGPGRDQPETAVVAGCFLAAAVAGLFSFPLDDTSGLDWLAIAYLGVFQIGLAYYFVTQSMRQLPVIETSLLLLVEPAFTPLWAWLLLAENPGALAMLGGAVIILAIGFYSLLRAPTAS